MRMHVGVFPWLNYREREAYDGQAWGAPREVYRDEDFREWVDNCYAELVGKRQRPEDVSYRRRAAKRLDESEEILRAVAAAAGVRVDGLKERRRDWAWKGIAARMLCKHGAYTHYPFSGTVITWHGVTQPLN